MNLLELNPIPSKIKINGKTHKLRAWTVSDKIWLLSEYEDRINEIFDPQNIDLKAVCRSVYRLIEDKSPFEAEEVETYDEDGNKEMVMIGGWKKLALEMNSTEDQVSLFTGLMECIGLSAPVATPGKKKVTKKKSKKKPTGRK